MKFTTKKNVVGPSIRLYQDGSKRWHWEYRNHATAMAKSASAFLSKQGCKNNAISVANGMKKALK